MVLPAMEGGKSKVEHVAAVRTGRNVKGMAGYPRPSPLLGVNPKPLDGREHHKEEICEQFSSGFTDNLCFLIQNDNNKLSDLVMVEHSGFQMEVQDFLNDPAAFPWACLARVRMPAYHGSENLGIVVIKSSDGTAAPLRISAGIWLRRQDARVLRRILAQLVLQVFGQRAMHENSDVRRNHFTIPGVDKSTEIEAHFCCFIKNEKLQKTEKLQPEMNHIELQKMLARDGLPLLKAALLSLNLKLTGEEQDFLDYADIVAHRFKVHPDKLFQIVKSFVGCWVPGNLFKLTLFEQLCEALNGSQWRKELDGHTVVLLPSSDITGNLPLKEEEEVLVAPVDSRRRAIYLVPRIALHPVSTDGKQLEPGTEKPKELTKYLEGKYQYKVLVRSGDTWRKAHLCLEVVGGDRCMVQFEDEGEQAKPEAINVSDLRLARDLLHRSKLSEGQEVHTVASSEMTETTTPRPQPWKKDNGMGGLTISKRKTSLILLSNE